VGYSVQTHHVEKLPEIRRPNEKRTRRFLIGDSIEGWADSVKALILSYYRGTSRIRFDFSDIRPKGARLVTSGGKAPGPQPLRECLVKLEGILSQKEDGDKLTPIEVHDMICHIADAVLAGGIRRAALIALFSADDDEMIASKVGDWWETNPHRGRANNSAVILRHKVDKDYFLSLWDRIQKSGSGEPGIYLSNDKDWGTNPCCVDGETLVMTDKGEMTMAQLVSEYQNGSNIKVVSFSEDTGDLEFRSVEAAAMTREDASVIKIETEDGQTITLTPDHRVYTENRGYVEAADLTEDDILLYIE
jgi:ribonucleoside-diphosphate reductase alpha chain